MLVVTNLLCGFVENQVRYNLESAQVLLNMTEHIKVFDCSFLNCLISVFQGSSGCNNCPMFFFPPNAFNLTLVIFRVCRFW